MLNCGLGTIFLPILGVAALIKGQTVLQTISRFFAGEEVEGYIVVIVITAVCLVVAMNDMVVPSVSLEGKNLWILQSLPVKPWNILRAKLGVQLLLTGLPVLFCEICLAVCLRMDIAKTLFILVLPIVFTGMMSVFGLFLGINMPNLTWTNELAPIKQSLGVVISMFGGWALAAGVAVLYFVAGKKIGAPGYLLLATIVFALITGVFYIWLKRKGMEKWMTL